MKSLRPSDTYRCFGNLTIIGSDNDLSPGRRQAIIWTNAGILLIWPLGINFSEILIEIIAFSFNKMCLKVSSAKRRPFCLGLDLLTHWGRDKMAAVSGSTSPRTELQMETTLNYGSSVAPLTLIPTWINNHMPSKVCDEITYPFLSFDGCAVGCNYLSMLG